MVLYYELPVCNFFISTLSLFEYIEGCPININLLYKI